MLFTRAFFFFLLAGAFLAPPALGSISLNVPFHRQEHTLSCEIATLKMALATYGISVSEADLIRQLPFDTTSKADGVWGDPNQGFVGDINGRMLVTGYGVYWDPLAKVGNKYAPTEVIRHGSLQDLTRHLDQGHPIIIWGYYGRRALFQWRTPAGRMVKAVNGEHTRVVYGYDGPASNPSRFYLLDPLSGKLTWSTEELMHNWSALDHMAVAVLPPRRWVRVPGNPKIWEIDPPENTRRWVTTWDTFIRRGGRLQAVVDISADGLLQYRQESDIL